MRKTLLSIGLSIGFLAFLSAQSLYQDAHTMAGILRMQKNASGLSVNTQTPKLLLMQERTGVFCVFSEDAPTVAAAGQSGLVVPIQAEAFNNDTAEIRNNQIKLLKNGYYSLAKLEPTDTIYIQLPAESVQLYFNSDSALVVKHAADSVALVYDSILVLRTAVDGLYIYGKNSAHSIRVPPQEEEQNQVLERKILLRPAQWNVPPQASFYLNEKQARLASNELSLKDGDTYRMKGKAWSGYLFYLKQGANFLSDEQEPFRITDSLQITYEHQSKQIRVGHSGNDTKDQQTYNTSDLKTVASILATHQHFGDTTLYDRDLIGETFEAYQQNYLLRQPLQDFFKAQSANLDSLTQSDLEKKLLFNYAQYYPWKQVLYDKKGLTLEKKISYQDLMASYRRPRITASQHLQQSSAALESKRKRLGGGINASTIVAGISDFIVERAQEELNMTFMNRMKESITEKYPEFQLLFPNTLNMLTNFQVDQYRSFLSFSKATFLADLDNLGVTFPRLFDLERYQIVADDPNVYNISLIYDLANKIYEDTPIDSVMLHLYTRLDERLDNLDNRVLRTLSSQLIAEKSEQEKGKKKSSELDLLGAYTEQLFQQLYEFDLMTEMGMHSLGQNLDAVIKTVSNRDEIKALQQLSDQQKKRPNFFDIRVGKVSPKLPVDSTNSHLPYYGLIKNGGISGAKPVNTEMPAKALAKTIGTQEVSPLTMKDLLPKAIDSLLVYDDNLAYQGPVKQLSTYHLLIPKALEGEIVYEYQLKKLPFGQYDEYFRDAPTSSDILMEGITLLREFLAGDQLIDRRKWIDNLTKSTEASLAELVAVEKKQQEQAYSPVVIAASRIDKQFALIRKILDQRIASLMARADTAAINQETGNQLEYNAAALEDIMSEIRHKAREIVLGRLSGNTFVMKGKMASDIFYEVDGEEINLVSVRYKFDRQNLKQIRKRLDGSTGADYLKLKPIVDSLSLLEDYDKLAVLVGYKDPEIKIKRIGEGLDAATVIKDLLVQHINSIESSMHQVSTKEEVEKVIRQFDSTKKGNGSADRELAGALQITLQKKSRKLGLKGEAGNLQNEVLRLTQELRDRLMSQKSRDSLLRVNLQDLLDRYLLEKIKAAREEEILKDVQDLLKPFIKAERTAADNASLNRAINKLKEGYVNKLEPEAKSGETKNSYARLLTHSAYGLRYLLAKLDSMQQIISTPARQYDDSRKPLTVEQEKTLRENIKKFEDFFLKTVNELKRIDARFSFTPQDHRTSYYPLPTQVQIDQLISSGLPGVKADSSRYTYSNFYSPRSKLDSLYRSQALGKLRGGEYDVTQLERLQQAELIFVKSVNPNVTYFEQLSTMNHTMALWLDDIEKQFHFLSEHIDTLGAHFAAKAFKARRQAQDLHTITEIGIHLLDAFKSGSVGLDSIISLENVERKVIIAQGDTTTTFTSTDPRPITLAKGRNIKKWITREQFSKLMSDPLTRDIYLGLLYQRLANIEGNENITKEGIALVATKLIGTIYDVDELRARLRKQKANGDDLSFKDYYPFVRTSVDFLNILLDTPIGRQAFSRQHPELANFSKISDQSLSLFENVFAKNYGEAIQNLVNLFAYIWKVDLNKAQEEEWAIQSLPTLAAQGKATAASVKEVKGYQKDSYRFQKALLVYGNFMAKIVSADDAAAVKAALVAAAVPPGSSSVKRTSQFNISLNGYFGGGVYREVLNRRDTTGGSRTGTTVGLSVPVGFTATIGGIGPKNWSYSLFVPILDLGVVTSYRIDARNEGQSDELPELTFGNLIAPGAYFIVNIPRSPFSIAAGAQLGPQLRKITLNGAETKASAWRYGITATIDVPIFNLYNR